MIINQAALKRQSTVLLLMVMIIVTGVYSYMVLPRESDPDITIPFVFVTTNYEGVAPEDMETLVTNPLERKLKGLSDVEEMTSISADGFSQINIEFATHVDIDDAVTKVRDKVDQAKNDLPSDLENDPEVTEENFSEAPVIQVALTGPYSLKRLKQFAEDFEERFETINGVLEANLVGGLDREIHVEFDLERIAGYRAPLSDMMDALSAGNVNMPGGSMDIGDAKYLVRVPEEYKDPQEIGAIVAYVRNGKPVYLRDIARIRDHYKDRETISRLDGENSVTVIVVKRSGENAIRIVEDVKRMVEELRVQFPPSLNISYVNDMSEDVKNMVTDLENNILTGLVLVLGVVFLFIGGRSALFVSLSIPFSMFITFAILNLMGFTLNMVVLFSLTLALGMLVDNGIVIVENIYRHMQEGKSRLVAAREAVDEVAWPVITSTLTTLGAFFPIMFWPGIVGEFMGFLPQTVIIALTSSLVVALVINPVLSARFQTVKALPVAAEDDDKDAGLTFGKRMYRALLGWSLRHRGVVVLASFSLLGAAIVAFGMFGKGMEFMPDIEPQFATVTIKSPAGTNLDASDRLARQAEEILLEDPDIKFLITKVGSESKGTHISELTIEFKDLRERIRPSSQTVDSLRAQLKNAIHGAEVRLEKAEDGPPTGAPVNMELYGKEIDELGRLTDLIKKKIKEVPGMVNLRDDALKGKPELTVAVDKEKAALIGLTAFQVARTVKAAIQGSKVGVYREGKDEYDIIARLPKEDRNSIEKLKRITISGPEGAPVPLTSLATVKVDTGFGVINHINQNRVVTISADVTGRTANDVIADVEKKLASLSLPRGYYYQFTGEQEEQDESAAFLSKAFIGAVFIIFMVLVTQFNSFVTPFIILTSVMLSLIGVFTGLMVTGKPFGVIMTGVGVISLAGVVVNNAIVLIDYYNQLRAQGMPVHDALMQTGLTRFRPVMLTAVTTILGLLPMAAEMSFNFIHLRIDVGGESAQWWSSMANAVIFGLAVATLLTLVVVPVLLSITESVGAWRLRRAERRADKQVEKPAPPSLGELLPAPVLAEKAGE